MAKAKRKAPPGRNNILYNRSWKDNKRGFSKGDYVPLDQREDWNGKVEVLPSCWDSQ